MADLEYMVPQTAAEIEHRLSYPVLYKPQELSAAEKAQARMNIGAASEDINGFEVVGYFDTLEDLEAAVTEPKAGPFYGVGTEPPLKYYSWDEMHSIWADNGGIKGVDGAPGKDGVDGKDGKDAVITPESITAGLGYTPGTVVRNYVDNPNFAFPVNQRGKTIYSGSVYGIDRWKNTGASSAQELVTGGVKFTNTTTSNMFRQDVDNVSQFAGKKMTFAMMLESVDGSTPSAYIRVDKADGTNVNARGARITEKGISSCVINVPDDVTSIYCGMVVDNAAGASGIANWAAIYEGEFTAENLPRFEIPDYGEQLARCQRYFVKITTDTGTANLGVGFAPNTSAAYVYFSLPVEMRAKPSITFVGGLYNRTKLTAIDYSAVSINNFMGFALLIKFAANVTAGDSYGMTLTNTNKFELSADL